MLAELEGIVNVAAQLNAIKKTQSSVVHYITAWQRLVDVALVHYPYLLPHDVRINVVTAIITQLFAKVLHYSPVL